MSRLLNFPFPSDELLLGLILLTPLTQQEFYIFLLCDALLSWLPDAHVFKLLVNLSHFPRENLHLLEEGQGLPREELDERMAREEFRRPRESLLNICTEFYKHCGPRLKILQNLAGEPRVTALELLDVKSHMRYCSFPARESGHS